MKPGNTNPEKGAALVEYGILVGLVAVLAIGAVTTLGEEIQGTFGTVESSLASSLASAAGGGNTAPVVVVTPPSGPVILASVTITPQPRNPGSNFGIEIGWSQQSVDPTGSGTTVGTVVAQTSGAYQIASLYTQGLNSQMRLYLAGDVSGDDFTGVSLSCSNGARTYDLENGDNFTADFRPLSNTTFWLWQGLDQQFVPGVDVTCSIQ